MEELPQLIFGTYEQFILGYETVKSNDENYQLHLNMASHAHLGSIRSLAVNKNFLASAGADEYINVFNMIDRKEVAVLTPHEGTITSVLYVPDGTHLISGSQDGNISIFRCSDWNLMKAWKNAHKKPSGVVGMSVHPSGKLLLSIGADSIMRVWNLVKGRQAYAVNFAKKTSPGNTLNLVSWSVDGSHYAVAIGNTIEIYKTETAAIVFVAKINSKISCIDLCLPSMIGIGRDDGLLEIHNYLKKEQVLEHKTHEKRLKCLQLLPVSKNESYLYSADSLGTVRIGLLQGKDSKLKVTPVAEVNADCRIVCMALLNPANLVKTEEKNIEKKKDSIKEIAIEKMTANNNPGQSKKTNDSEVKKSPKSQESAKRSSISTPLKSSTKVKRKSLSTTPWTVT